MHKRILIATNGDDVSKKAVTEGVDLAKECGAKIIGLYVIDVGAFNIMDVGSDELARLKNQQTVDGKRALSLLKELADTHGVNIEMILREGEPVKEIINVARDYKADLIVMGSHCRKGLGKLIEGSVAERSVKDAPCPVMVAHC
jgi:nucleotide-binding universal stress UspA family protein